MNDGARFFLGVVVLAAGASSRMGRPKLLLPWNDTTVIGAILTPWRTLGAEQIAVVCRPDDVALNAELDRLSLLTENRIFNPSSDSGMFTSIRLAAKWNGWSPAITHWAIALGDQPHLSRVMLSLLLETARRGDARICQPSFRGRARHPVILPRAHFEVIENTPHGTLKDFLAAHKSSVELVEATDPGVDCDIDTPEDYRAAVERFGAW